MALWSFIIFFFFFSSALYQLRCVRVNLFKLPCANGIWTIRHCQLFCYLLFSILANVGFCKFFFLLFSPFMLCLCMSFFFFIYFFCHGGTWRTLWSFHDLCRWHTLNSKILDHFLCLYCGCIYLYIADRMFIELWLSE